MDRRKTDEETVLNIRLRLKRDDLRPAITGMWDKLRSGGRRSLLGAVGDEFRAMAQEQFGADRPNRPAPWAPLSKRYQKRIKYSGPPKLILSGHLNQSMTVNATDQVVFVSANEGYAEAQQFGRPEVNLPARPFFPVVNGQLTDYAKDRIGDRIKRVLGFK